MAANKRQAPQLIHPWLRWPLRLYKALLVFVLLAILGNIAVVPLANRASDWSAATLHQIAALLDLLRTYPLWFSLIVVVLIILFGLSMVAEHEAQRQQAAADEAHTTAQIADTTKKEVNTQLERVLPSIAKFIVERTASAVLSAPTSGLSTQFAEEVETGVYELLHSWATAVSDEPDAVVPLLPIASGYRVSSTLPRVDLFIDREHELTELVTLVRTHGATDAVAVVGPGAIGKTALVAKAVSELTKDADAFPGGFAWVWYAGNPGVAELTEVWAGMAQSLGLGEFHAFPHAARAAVLAALHNPTHLRTLLVLDEFVPSPVASALLDALVGSQATLVLTARQDIVHDRVAKMQLGSLNTAAGTELFVRRLRQVDHVRPTPDEMANIGTFVRLLEGHPLAISLAAQFVGEQHQPVPVVLAAMQDTVSVRAVLDRVWQMLTRQEQLLLVGLSFVQEPHITWTTAQAIDQAAAAAAGGSSTSSPVDDVNNLAQRALIQLQPGEWLQLHPLVRAYVEEQLAQLPGDIITKLREAAE